jgi:tetratricopeptide (TPR) repeat protein
MPKRYFNWKLAIVLVISVGVLTVTAIWLRRWQKANSAEQGLLLGNKAYEEQNWEETTKQLGRYLLVRQDDAAILVKYAEAQMHIRPRKRGNIQQAIAAYRTALRVDDTQKEAARKLTEIYLTMGMPGEAELIAKRQLEKSQDPNLQRMLGVALAQQRKFDEASDELKAICTEHPAQVLAYESLGQLIERYPEEFPDQAVNWYNQAVKNNPSSALAYIVRAGYYLRNNDRSKAMADISIAERQDLSDSSVRLRLAGELINLNLLDKAEQHLEAVYKTTPTNQNLWQFWAHLALRSQSKEKMFDIAEKGLKELSFQPWDFMPTAAELFIRSDHREQAADCILKLRQQDMAPAIVANLEALMAADEGNFFEAVRYWKQSVEAGNKSTQIRLALASALIQIGDRQSALQQLYALLAEQPDSFEGHLVLARMLAQSADWAEVQDHAAKALELAPTNPEPAILYLRARLELIGGNPTGINAEIIQEIEKRLSALNETIPGNFELDSLRVQFMMQQGNFADAQELINRMKEQHPSEAVGIALTEAELLVAQNKTSQAISILNEAIEKFPDALGPVRYLAILLYRQGDQAECETVIKDALARMEQPVIQRELGLILAQFYTQRNKTDQAYAFLTTLSQNLPNDIPIKRRLLLCEQVINNPEKTQQLIDQIKSLEGENGWQWRYEQAKALFITDDFKNNYPKIISFLQENILANPNDQTSRTLLARTYDKAGELQLAISTYRDALNRSPDDLRIITPMIAALYKAREYDQAEQLLNRASREKLQNNQLQKLRLQSLLRQGKLDSASDILQDLLNRDPNNQGAHLSLALLKMQQNKFEESEKLLTQLKTQEPNSLAVTATLIQLYLRQDKPEQALEICREITGNVNNAPAYILSARTYATLGQPDKALEELNRAISLEPDDVEVWIARSDYYRSIGHTNEAAEDIKHALSMAPDNLQIQKRAISLFLTSKQPNMVREGNTFLDKALESNPDDIELQLFKTNSLLLEGTTPAIENAKQLLQKITEKEPERSQAWLMLGELMLKQGQPGKAVDVALRGLAYKNNDKSLMLLKARAETVRSPILAIPTLKELCVLDPNDIDAVILLAGTYLTTGEPQKAVNILKQQLLICEPPINRKCRIILAVALYKAGSKSESQEEFKALTESDPNDPSPLLAQVQLLKEEQLWSQLNLKVVERFQKYPNDSHTPVLIARDLASIDNNESRQTAEDILRLVLKNDPSSTEAMSVLAILLEMTGHSDESADLYRRLIELQPENLIAINNLAWILSEKKGQYQRALELAQKGLKLAPNYIDLVETRGVVFYRMGELTKSIDDLTRCVELYPISSPQYVGASFHLARALNQIGRKEEALKYLNQALNSEGKAAGLSTAELNEAKHLLIKLQEGN